MTHELLPPQTGRNRYANDGMPAKREVWTLAAIGIVIAIASLIVFVQYPGLDLAVSAHHTDAKGRFPASSDDWINLFRKGALFAIFAFYVMVAGAWIDAYNRQVPVLGHEWHRWSFIGTSALIGPVLVVNVLLKGNWGRARPNVVEEFGGNLKYTDFWVWSDQCRDNCSFSSGEVGGVAMVFLSLAFILPVFWRSVVLSAGAVCTAIIAWKRIAMGAHFLSDTIMSVSFMMLVVAAVYWFFYLRPAPWISWFDQKRLAKLDSKKS